MSAVADTRHFEFQELAEGVWAAIARDGGLARSNGGFVDLGGVTVVIDTHMTPLASGEVRAAAELVTGQPVSYVFYTHLHLDHVFGAPAYDAATRFIGTDDTRAMMAEQTQAAYESSKAAWPGQIAALEQAVAGQTDPAQRASQERELENLRELAASLSDFEARLPDITFADQLTLHGTRRGATLLQVGGGHSPDDAVLYLPDDGILFSGDLLFNGRHPFMGGGGSWHDWVGMLAALYDELAPNVIVPGHGPVTDAGHILFMRQYLTEIDRLVDQAVRGGAALDEAKQLAMPELYSAWPATGGWERNIEILYRRRTA